jgi:outer membrane receptor protein involved in Fe transport
MRFPTMRNLYADGVVGPLGNPDLEEESTISVEIGSSVDVNNKLKLGGSFFYNDIKNMISLDNQIGRFEQYPEASIAGFELTANGRITDSTDAYLAYTFLRARADSEVTINNQYWASLVYRPEELPYRPAHQIDLELRHRFPFGLDANLNGAYFSRATYYDHANLANNKVLLATKGELGSYLLMNAKVSQKLPGGFSLYFAVENMLNKYYETLYLFPSAGRTYRGGLRVEM